MRIPENVEDLAQRAKQGDYEATVRLWLAIGMSIALAVVDGHVYQLQHANLDEVAALELLEAEWGNYAIPRWQPSRGPFKPFAWKYVKWHLEHFLKRKIYEHAPHRFTYDRHNHRLWPTNRELEEHFLALMEEEAPSRAETVLLTRYPEEEEEELLAELPQPYPDPPNWRNMLKELWTELHETPTGARAVGRLLSQFPGGRRTGEIVIGSLLDGYSLGVAADRAGISRATAYRWTTRTLRAMRALAEALRVVKHLRVVVGNLRGNSSPTEGTSATCALKPSWGAGFGETAESGGFGERMRHIVMERPGALPGS